MQLQRRYSYILRSKWRKISRILFLLPGLLGVCIFVLIPFGDVIRRSFCTSLSNQYCGWKNYTAVFENRAFRLAAGNTLKFLAACLPLLLTGSLLIALCMYHFSQLEKYRTLYLLPMAMPAATIVLVWKLLFAKQGFFNGLFGLHIDFLGGEGTFWVLVGTYIWKNLGYTVILWLAALKAVPEDILDAAKVDGAGSTKTFFLVILPSLKGGLYTITVLSFLNAFKVFREAYLVNGAYPPEDTYLLQHVFNNWYTNLDLDKMAAGAVLAALVLGSVAVGLKALWDNDKK